jgi:heptosyltransferase-3
VPEPRDILYINVSRIGDTLLVTPAVRAVAALAAGAHHPAGASEARGSAAQAALRASHRQHEKARARFMGRLPRAKPYDLAFVCNFDAPLVDYALRVARRVVAFRQPDAALNRRLYRAVEHPALQTTHAVDIQLMLPAALGVAPAGKALAYRVTDDESVAGQRSFLEQPSIARPKRIRWSACRWPAFPTKAYRDWPLPGHFSAVPRIQCTLAEAHFLIFGGELEKVPHRGAGAELGNRRNLCAGRSRCAKPPR